MTHVYVLMYSFDGFDPWVVAVFTSRELAEAAIVKWHLGTSPSRVWVDEFPLDAPGPFFLPATGETEGE